MNYTNDNEFDNLFEETPPEPSLSGAQIRQVERIAAEQLIRGYQALQQGVAMVQGMTAEAIRKTAADNIQGRLRFQDALEKARLRYYAEVGSNPRLSKDALIGKVYLLSERLASDREDAQASEALFRLAKIQGWIAGEGGEQPSPVDLLARLLTQSDLDTLKAQIDKAEEQGELFDWAGALLDLKAKRAQPPEQPTGKAKVNYCRQRIGCGAV